MTGTTCVVTGATSGIGLEVARTLAEKGARVIGVGRDPARCAEACASIRDGTGNPEVAFETADLSDQAQLRSLARRLAGKTGRVDVLVNNAGTFTLARKESADGIEMQLAVNWLAGFMLTGLLLPLLQTAPRARVVTVSSGSHFAGRLRWDDIQLRRRYHGLKAYDQSKLATVLFTYELARRLGPGAAVSAYAVDPGLVKTEIGAKGNGPFVRMIWGMRARGGISPMEAGTSVAFCAMDAAAAGKTGLYWKDRGPVASSRPSYDKDDSLRLWELGEELCGVRYP